MANEDLGRDIRAKWKTNLPKADGRWHPSMLSDHEILEDHKSILQNLYTSSRTESTDSFEDFQYQETLKEAFRISKDFRILYLCLCLEKRPGYLNAVVRIVIEGLSANTINHHPINWQELLDDLYEKAVDMDSVKALKEVLTVAHDPDLKLTNGPWYNCDALVKACIMDQLTLALLLIEQGYNLQSKFIEKECNSRKRRNHNWHPMRQDSMEERTEKEMKKLNVIRAMSTPCYLLARYWLASSKTRDDKEEFTSPHFLMSPGPHCLEHSTCNDPIYWNLIIRKATKKNFYNGNKFREEYDEVSKACDMMPLELVQQCSSINEGMSFLDDTTGPFYVNVEAYAPFKHQRLLMAIQNHYQEFVANVLCQEIILYHWEGNTKWHRRTKIFKIFHSFMQLFFMPFHIGHYLIHHLLAFATDEKAKNIKVLQYFTGPCNLDVPINRFITFTWTYLFLCVLTLACASIPLDQRDTNANQLHWTHILLGVMTAGLILRILQQPNWLKNAKDSPCWTLFDALLAITLSLGLAFKLTVSSKHCVNEESCNREKLTSFSNCFYSVAAGLGIFRFAYWMQLMHSIGILVINIRRVTSTLLTFLILYGLFYISCTLTLVPLKAASTRCTGNQTLPENATCEQLELDCCWTDMSLSLWWLYFKIMMTFLLWLIFNPENPGVMFSYHKIEGDVAIFVTTAFVIVTIIMFMNLLIALMNASIQMVQDKSHIYWKFTRSSIWVEFSALANALPLPFNLLQLVALPVMFILDCVKQRKAKQNQTEQVDSWAVPLNDNNGFSEEQQKMKAQNVITMKLIGRYWLSKQKVLKEAHKSNQVALEQISDYINN